CQVWDWTADRSGKFLIFVCSDAAQILSFNIDAKTGAPTGTPTSSPISQIMNPRQVLIDVTGQFLYLLETDRVIVNSIDSQTGAVSEGAVYATWCTRHGVRDIWSTYCRDFTKRQVFLRHSLDGHVGYIGVLN